MSVRTRATPRTRLRGVDRARDLPAATREPIARRSLHDELLQRLRELIVEGALVPGAKVPERELCEQFAVSRTPMREALKVLAAEGLVVLMPNRGATVSELTRAELEEVFPVMGSLEALAGRLAAEHIEDGEIADIRRLHERMVRHYQSGELKAYFRVNQEIHERILDAARNPTLAKLYRGLAGRVRRARYIANMSPERWRQAVIEHEAILAALSARDGRRLARLLESHLAHKLETVREALERDD
ncbi:MAG: GntR family transcriptional regulator [Hyphomicrobiaceae bacterium]|nr:GntR family transcriptional regulator [Hyphomicrobiaceae bacterium]